jgi:hypothetical protein
MELVAMLFALSAFVIAMISTALSLYHFFGMLQCIRPRSNWWVNLIPFIACKVRQVGSNVCFLHCHSSDHSVLCWEWTVTMKVGIAACVRCVRLNKSVNADTQGRPRVRRSNSLGASYFRR